MAAPDPGEPQIIYDTIVTAVGPMVADFAAAGVLILFGDNAPEELHEFVALHHPVTTDGDVRAGDVIELGTLRLAVTAVGDVAVRNLQLLGHISIKADGAAHAALPGDISVEPLPLPLPTPGTRVRIVRPGGHLNHN